MNKKLRKLAAVVLAVAMIMGIMLIVLSGVKAQPPQPSLYLDPSTETFSTSNASVGTLFNVTGWIDAPDNSSGWDAALFFDPTQLQVVTATYSGSGGKESLWMQTLGIPVASLVQEPVVWNNTDGTVGEPYGCGETILGLQLATIDVGSLFIVEFNITQAPPPGGSLSNIIQWDPNLSSGFDQYGVVEGGFNYGNCTYTFSSGVVQAKNQITFTQTGLDSSASGTVVTVNGTAETLSQLPYSTLVNSGDTLVYSYQTTVASSTTGEQFQNTGVNASSPLTVSSNETVTGSYETQYRVSFAVSPSGAGTTTPSGTNVNETAGSLPISAEANSGFVFSSWTTTGSITVANASASSTTATISGPGNITANFVTGVTFVVNFTETGLPSGTSWSVMFNGSPGSSTTSSITFTGVANGGYPYTVGTLSGFSGSPSSGTVTVSNANVTVAVNFTAAVTYSVSFTETGLSSDTSWSVTFNGSQSSSTTSTITFEAQNGTYSYSVTGPTGFAASPASGSVLVRGTGVNVSIAFASTLTRSSTSIVCSPNPGHVNSPITCTATVTGSSPTGKVTWSTSSSTGSFSPTISTLSKGSCSTTYIDISSGSVNITASFSGDSNNLPSNDTIILTLTASHDVIVVSVSANASVTQGVEVPIDVAVLNNGTVTETSVVVNATANGTLIGTPQTLLSLSVGNTTTLTFTWNTTSVSAGTYILTATVTPPPAQTDLSEISKSTTTRVVKPPPTQFYLTVASAHGSPSPPSGFFNSGMDITESVTSPVSGGTGTQYVCTGWTGSGSVPASGTGTSVPFAIASNSTITWTWKTQFEVTIGQQGVGSDFTGTVATVDGSNYTLDALPSIFWWDNQSNHSFSFASPLTVNTSKQYTWNSTSGLSTLQNGTLTVTGPGSLTGNYVTVSSTLPTSILSKPSFDLAGAIALGLLAAALLLMFIGIDASTPSRKKKQSPDAPSSWRALLMSDHINPQH
ncbi:MAG: Ig-like domain repeat protein [Candidatus Bathyarchaeia archaeon]